MVLARYLRFPHFNPRSPHGERLREIWMLDGKIYNFNPRSPHGERRTIFVRMSRIGIISTHAPRTGSDLIGKHDRIAHDISTHAPRTGSDGFDRRTKRTGKTFQPTLPARGATEHAGMLHVIGWVFQPTLPARGATRQRRRHPSRRTISTHAPRTGSDVPFAGIPNQHWDFNPRSPHGERQRKVTILSIRIIGFAQKVYHKTVLLRISLAENAVILPEKP